MKTSFSFMAFSAGKESTEAAPIKRYIGVAPCEVLAINPNKAKLEELLGTTLEKEPEYLSKVERDGKEVERLRVSIWVKPTDADPINVSMFLFKEYRYNRDKTKVQVIDKYGRTAWVTIEQAKNHEIPMYSNGPAKLDKEYRPCLNGEEELTQFIRTFLNIDNVDVYNSTTKEWGTHKDPSSCEGLIDDMSQLFKGNVSQLTDAIALQSNNKIKICFGVRTADDGKMYQTAFTRMFLRNRQNNYTKLAQEIENAQKAGAYSNTEFSICDLREYNVESTTFEEKPAEDPFTSDLPFTL